MIKLILNLLEKIPYRTKFGTSLADDLKSWWFYSKGHHNNCLCGGIINVHGLGQEHWIVEYSIYDYVFMEK